MGDKCRRCIYMLISPSHKVYVGKTNDLKARYKQHARAAGGCTLLHKAIRKYGWEAFIKVVLEEFESNVTDGHMFDREEFFVDKYGSFGPRGYNLTKGGVSGFCFATPKDTRTRREKLRDYAKHRPTAHQEKINKALRSLSKAQRRIRLKNLQKANAAPRLIFTPQERRANRERRQRLARGLMKPVIATHLWTLRERRFHSLGQAAAGLNEEFGNARLVFRKGNISRCARGKIKSHCGWTFRFE